MKHTISALFLLAAVTASAAPLRVAVLDFEDQTGMKAEELLGGAIAPSALAAKGVSLLSSELLGTGDFVLIDRRDFIAQQERTRIQGGEAEPRPSFLRTAQALNADIILRGSLQSFSTGKQVVDQGGYRTEFAEASLRVAVEALDTTDGTVVALVDGVANESFRQTSSTFTVLNEEAALTMMEAAIGAAVPELTEDLQAYATRQQQRPKVMITITTSDDPALVEIDGLLVGSTPLENYPVYQGDHVLTLGKAGYFDVSKRVLFEKDVAIEVPMIRVQLSADEVKEVLEKARLHIFQGEPGMIIHEIDDRD